MDGARNIHPTSGPLPVVPTLAALIVIAMFVLPSQSFGEDVVTLRGAKGEPVRRKGTIVDFLGDTLTIEWSTGRREPIKTAKLISFSTPRHPDHVAGRKLLDRGQFEKALTSLRKAVEGEPRVWMKREILSQWVRCYVGLGRIDRAGDVFLRFLLPSDRQTQFFSVIPLSWQPRAVHLSLQTQAQTWLNDRSEAAQLIGASWLLSTTARDQAVAALRRLASSTDRRVAFLAEAQLWKARLNVATEAEVRQWQERVGKIPRDLRGGPYYVIGQLLARLKKPQPAALALLRVPVLYPHQQTLGSEALLLAGRQLEQVKQFAEAKSLYQEIILKTPDTVTAAEAKHRYEMLVRTLSQKKK